MGISLKLTYLLFWITFGEFVQSDQNCYKGVLSRGYTVPKGDMVIRHGDPLDIYCVLNENGIRYWGPNASHKITFKKGKTALNSEMIQIINETTIRLHVDKPELGKREFYGCKVKGSTDKICGNFVYVGVPPQEITDFRCLSANLDNLTCRWTAPQNYLVTTYNLSFSLVPDSSLSLDPDSSFNCPKIEGEDGSEMKCTWSMHTAEIYRQNSPVYYFTLTASNILGNYTMPRMVFKHYEHVRPNAPENLKAKAKSWNSVELSWTIPSTLQVFSSGLHCRVLYQSSYGTKEWHQSPIFAPKENARVKYKLNNLVYAHAIYDIRVSLRSAVADPNDESMWSDNATEFVLTASKKPDYAPKTNIGSFEIVTYGNNSDRNVRIYWSHIPNENRNGENFTYVVTLQDDEEFENTTDNAFLFYERLSPHRSYTFHIRSRNEMGYSDGFSVVTIPAEQDCAREPTRLRKEELDMGYRLSWQPPKLENHQELRNYTIFWCNDDKERPPCTGKLDWVVVPSNSTSHVQRIPSNRTFQFAISANTDRGSSGMTWAHCTDLYYKYSVRKVDEFHRVNFTARNIRVKWIFGCYDKSVTGFIIYYCPIWSPQNSTCKEAEKNTTVPSNETSVEIQGLEPYTIYSLQVSAVINFTVYSQRSELVQQSTLESAPTPPRQLKLTNVTNSTVSLMWHVPEKNNGILKYYQVFYNNISKRINPGKDPKAKMVVATLTDLTSFKNYTITVQACTVECSNNSEEIRVQTEIGYPGEIRKPFITQNATYTSISWDSPQEANGRIEYYELKIKEKQDNENKTTKMNITGQEWGFNSCGKEKVYSFFVSVRAINLDGDKLYHGRWSDEVQSYCRSPGNYTIYLLVPFIILFFSGMTYLFKRLYGHVLIMKDVDVVMPLGLQGDVIEIKNQREDRDGHHVTEDEKDLLMKKNDGSPIMNVGDSSGCSSAHDSVTCSMDSASNISSGTSDSGTEQPKTQSTEDLADLTTTSLRQRNIRPLSSGKPYVVFPLDSTNSGCIKSAPKSYCVLGIDPSVNPEGSSTYIPLPSVMDKTVFSPSDSSHSPPYVVTGELLKTSNPSYIPFKTPLVDKNPAYVIAGSKDLMSADVSNLETKQAISAPDNAYIKIADNMTLKNANDIKSWQPSSLSTNSKTGYVTIGEIPPMKKESKGYVPHRQFESKALKED